jgi:hypothetical protein
MKGRAADREFSAAEKDDACMKLSEQVPSDNWADATESAGKDVAAAV